MNYLTIAAAAAIVVGLIGLIAIWASIPLLFASLGPTVVIQAGKPQQRIAYPWNVAAGHLIALGVGVAALYASGAITQPPFLSLHQLSPARISAAAFAVGIGIFIEYLLKASHPPAASTSLLVTLGVVPINAKGIIAVAGGIGLVTVFGELVRQLRLRL